MRRCALLLLVAAVLSVASVAEAGRCCPRTCCPQPICRSAPCAMEIQYVEKTVMCPVMITEHRTVQQVCCRAEVRQATVTCYRQVPETRMASYQCTVLVPEVRQKTVQHTVCKPVYRTETRQYTVMVPYTETLQGVRQVCKLVPTTVTKTVCEDQGHWEERPCEPATCAPATCAPATCAPEACAAACEMPTRKVWVPNVVTRQVPVTCMKPTMVEEPYTYTVLRCRPEVRTCTVNVCDYVSEVQTRVCNYTVYRPKVVTKTRPVTTYKCVPYQATRSYTVMAPYTVQRVVPVQVCKMVPKTIQVPVCVPKPVPVCEQSTCCSAAVDCQ